MTTRKITFTPQEKTVTVKNTDNLLQVAQKSGLYLESTCNGKGTCGKCRIRIESGSRESYTDAELRHLTVLEREKGIALACQCRGLGDMKVYLPPIQDELQRKTKGLRKTVALASDLKKVYLELIPPSLADQRSDQQRLQEALAGEIQQPLEVTQMAALPSLLRRSDFKITVALAAGKVIGIEAGDTRSRLFGIAFDIGTTTVVGSLLDLNTGQVLAASSHTNEQNVYGADVLSRIQYTIEQTDGLKRLQQKVITVINKIIDELTLKTGVLKTDFYQMTMVGNTTMAHLLLAIEPTFLAPAPFIPAFQSQVILLAEELGIKILPRGQVIVLPNIAGYVGSDTIAVMLAMAQGKKATLAIDIGTNGELVLACGDKLWACSTAAGPAFEGAQISCGMRAAEGAIEEVIVAEDLQLKVIGNVPAKGLCGSGLIDAVAELLRVNVIDQTGRIVAPEELEGQVSTSISQRLRETDDGWEFVLAFVDNGERDIVLTQKDVRELQLAKGAIRAGAEVLLIEAGLDVADLETIQLAGAFGNYIKKESALAIGLLPNVTLEQIIPIGNASGDGALLALASVEERAKAEKLAKVAKHIELSSRADFNDAFINYMYF